MTNKEFLSAFIVYYRIDINDATNKIRLEFLNDYLHEKNEADKNKLLKKLIKEYQPTGINPYPLVSHINEIINSEENEIIKQDAQNIADRIITASTKFGYTQPKEARAFIGEIGWRLVHECYSNWFVFSTELYSEQTEMTRAHLRDSAKALMGRLKRGVAGRPPEMLDNKIFPDEISNKNNEVMKISEVVKTTNILKQKGDL